MFIFQLLNGRQICPPYFCTKMYKNPFHAGLSRRTKLSDVADASVEAFTQI